MGDYGYLLAPLVLCVLYSFTECRSTAILGYAKRPGWHCCLVMLLPTAALMAAWSVTGFPLPVFYALAYLLRAERLLTERPAKTQHWFLLNLSFVNTMALHLVFIGAAALTQGVSMRALLSVGPWRAASVSVALAVSVAEDMLFLKWKGLAGMVAASAQSVEARPFMAFLYFCTGYLLADSLMCLAELEPVYPPLFLIGSSFVLMFLLIRFLLHINRLIQSNHLKDEHDQLSAELEERDRNAGALKRLADRDVLTGVYSRRYAMDRISDLIAAKEAFSLVFIDLDGLKRINDRDGHDAGDRYLIGFTGALGGRLRESDVFARVGGDEFLILMPGCGGPVAGQRIESIRAAMEESGEAKSYRFSFGVTELPAGAEGEAQALLGEADRAMYRDKEKRR